MAYLMGKREGLVRSCPRGRLRRGADWFWCAGLLLGLAVGLARAGPHPETQYAVRVWQAEQGLPENSVNCVAQTRDGYLWIGTFKGLVRFDGREFIWVGPQDVANERASRILCLYSDDADAPQAAREPDRRTYLLGERRPEALGRNVYALHFQHDGRERQNWTSSFEIRRGA